MTDETDTRPEGSTIPRPNNLLVGPSSQLRAPSSLLSGALPRSLLENNTTVSAFSGPSAVPILRPRRLWNVHDNALKRIPSGYPPLNPRCTTYVGDAPPSIVAVRIAECLRKRSISVEYDEEMNTAIALTVDRCMFQVQLYKSNPELFTQGVLVECHRISGSAISFHRACRAVLKAALGQSTGDDLALKPFQCNGREFQHMPSYDTLGAGADDRALLLDSEHSQNHQDIVSLKPQAMAAQALEQVMELMNKDRLDTQVLGMERLINLTTPSISGKDIALYTSRQLIQKYSRWIVALIIRSDDSSSDGVETPVASLGGGISVDEGQHLSQIRAFSVRALCNALSIVAHERLLAGILEKTKDHPLTDKVLLECLVNDLEGANRPPSIVHAGMNTLASIHETALAIRILRIMGDHSAVVASFLRSDRVLERLETARAIGRTSHIALQQEAERVYSSLTEDVRSC